VSTPASYLAHGAVDVDGEVPWEVGAADGEQGLAAAKDPRALPKGAVGVPEVARGTAWRLDARKKNREVSDSICTPPWRSTGFLSFVFFSLSS
jgi:hypothetical protein